MAYSVANIDKFIGDHPEIKGIADNRMKILNKAYEKADKRGFVARDAIKEILDDYAELFFEEADLDPKHIELGLRAFKVNDLNRALLSGK